MDRIENLLNRPKAYYNVDGVGELGIGFMCLSFALLGWLQVSSPEHSVWNGMIPFIIFIGLVTSIIHYGSKAIKNRITYPRTGFVEYRKRDTLWLPMILGFAVSAAVSAGVAIGIKKRWSLTTPASLVGLFFAATYAYGIARTVRWKWAVAGVMALGSIAIAMLPADAVGAVANHSWITRIAPARLYGAFWLNMALYGALTLISGGVSLCLYLRHTQAPAQESQ